MNEPNEDLNEKEALTALLATDGWRLYQIEMAKQWGPEAQLRAIDQALSNLPAGHQEAVDSTVQQIRSASNAIMAGLRWPAEQLARLKAAEERRSIIPGFRRRA